MSDLAIPLEGIRRAESQIDLSAKKLARLPVSASSGEGGADVVDLSAETVALLQNRRVAEANIKAFQSIDEVQKNLINILG